MKETEIMLIEEYECPECGEIAWRGDTVTQMNKQESEYLELHCRDVEHDYWGIEIRCTECKEVPSYLTFDSGEREIVPMLQCCGKVWVPKESLANPFLDERAI